MRTWISAILMVIGFVVLDSVWMVPHFRDAPPYLVPAMEAIGLLVFIAGIYTCWTSGRRPRN
jgi:hypothetical protein